MSFLLLQAGTAAVDSLNQVANMPTEETMSLLSLIVKGGYFMIPIVGLLVAAIYIFFERITVLRLASKDDPNFMSNIRDYVLSGNIESAKRLCENINTPLSRMIEKGVMRIGRPLKDIDAAVENVGKLEIYKLEKNVAAMATIAGAAPMIGFLGTVTGMIRAFYNMSKAGNNIDPGVLAGGIYEAMITTASGLVVGIIAYICYNILVTQIEKIVNKMEAQSIAFIDLLQEPV